MSKYLGNITSDWADGDNLDYKCLWKRVNGRLLSYLNVDIVEL